MKRVRVGVNLLYLKPSIVGGSEVYITRLLEAFEPTDDAIDATLFVNRRFASSHPDLVERFPTVRAPIGGGRPPVRIAAESSWLAWASARHRLDLVHHVANTIPYVRTRPSVVTIHDLQPFVRPQDFGRAKGRYLRERISVAASSSVVVMTPTEYVRRLVVDRFGSDPDRVIAVPAPAPHRAPPGARSANEPSIDDPFFLYPAITHPHKNHAMLVRAFARVVADRPEASLVLAGGRGAAEDEVSAEIDRHGLRRSVLRVGRIPRSQLDDLFGRAVAMTFPSRHEGYGLPVTEAMALGCPVIASGVTALPEVVGDAGILLDPDDGEAWTRAMIRLLDEPDARSRLIRLGREHARAPTAAESASRLARAYRLAVEDA